MEKRDLLKLFKEWREGKIKENDGEVNFTMIHCKNFCKCYNVPPSTTIKNKNVQKKSKSKIKIIFDNI
jgi:hypothetical protein